MSTNSDSIAQNADTAIRIAERDLMSPRSFDLVAHEPRRAAALAAVAALEQASAGDPRVGELRRRLAELADKADEIVVEGIRQSIDGHQRAATREGENFASERQ